MKETMIAVRQEENTLTQRLQMVNCPFVCFPSVHLPASSFRDIPVQLINKINQYLLLPGRSRMSLLNKEGAVTGSENNTFVFFPTLQFSLQIATSPPNFNDKICCLMEVRSVFWSDASISGTTSSVRVFQNCYKSQCEYQSVLWWTRIRFIKFSHTRNLPCYVDAYKQRKKRNINIK